MSVIIGRYTEAQFAATLLHCGPHDWHTCETKCSLNVSRPINIDYKDRVYNYFFELFPEMVEEFPAYAASEQMHKWTTFWHEYIEWVES